MVNLLVPAAVLSWTSLGNGSGPLRPISPRVIQAPMAISS